MIFIDVNKKIILPSLSMGNMSVRSNSLISLGFKSRPGSCPYTPVAQGSGVLATGGRKFPIGKAAGRNESEPTRSLVKLNRRCRPCGHKGKADVTGRENGSSLGMPRGRP